MKITLKNKRVWDLVELFGDDHERVTTKLVNKFLKEYINETYRKMGEYQDEEELQGFFKGFNTSDLQETVTCIGTNVKCCGEGCCK